MEAEKVDGHGIHSLGDNSVIGVGGIGNRTRLNK